MAPAKGYNIIPKDEYETDEATTRYRERRSLRLDWRGVLALIITFVISNFTVYHFTSTFSYPTASSRRQTTFAISDAANHPRDVPTVINYQSRFYDEENLQPVYDAWNSINVDAGMIALPESEVHDLGIPLGSPFYWEPSKRVYLIEGYHNLHCTKVLFTSITQYHSGTPQTTEFRHVLHCLDSLRQMVLCTADDTPRWVEYYGAPSSGLNQTRMCRSWDKLESWAKKHSACYEMHSRENVEPRLETLSRYSYCPPDSPYRKQIEDVFGNVFDE